MNESEKPLHEKIGKVVGHAVEISVAWITRVAVTAYENLKKYQAKKATEQKTKLIVSQKSPHVEKATPNSLADFFTFKLHLFPILVSVVYFLFVIWWERFIFQHAYYRYDGEIVFNINPMIFFFLVVIGPILVHLVLEFLVIPFSILDVQREVRNEMKTLNQQLAGLRIKQDTVKDEKEAQPEAGEK